MKVITEISKDTVFLSPDTFKAIYPGLVRDNIIAHGVTENRFVEGCCGYVLKILETLERA